MAEIKQGMDYDEWQDAWFTIARERGHTLRTWDDGQRVDMFVMDAGFHNGPGCETCGWSACMHCDWKAEDIPTCSAVPSDDGRGGS